MNPKLELICTENKIKSREQRKYFSFIYFLEQGFDLNRYDYIYDLCCGKGILSTYLAEQRLNVTGIDIKQRERYWSSKSVNFISKNIYEPINLENNSLLISIHACGNLTDRIIELALASKNDFAVNELLSWR